MQRIDTDFAYLLHSKPYRDNSALTYLLTKQNGKVGCIVNGIKSKRSNKRALLQPCHRLQINYELKTGLSKLTGIDIAPPLTVPDIKHFMLYQYINELLMTVLPEHLPVPDIFQAYEQYLVELNDTPHTALRLLELAVIEHFSGLPELSITQDTLQPVNSENDYYFYPDAGVYTTPQTGQQGKYFHGVNLQAFSHLVHYGRKQYSETLAKGALPVSHFLIQQLLGGKTLKTSAVYKALKPYTNL